MAFSKVFSVSPPIHTSSSKLPSYPPPFNTSCSVALLTPFTAPVFLLHFIEIYFPLCPSTNSMNSIGSPICTYISKYSILAARYKREYRLIVSPGMSYLTQNDCFQLHPFTRKFQNFRVFFSIPLNNIPFFLCITFQLPTNYLINQISTKRAFGLLSIFWLL